MEPVQVFFKLDISPSFLSLFIYIASCSDGQIKLIGGTSQASGQVEICSNQRWETLSRSQWTNNVASVACTELGLLGMYCSLYAYICTCKFEAQCF